MKPANGVPSWIMQAVEELGPEIGYSNLIYWAYENMIKAEEVDKTLKALVNMGYLTPIVEVRCPECGAHLGDFKQLTEIPEKIQCDECGHTFIKREELDSSYNLVFVTTEAGVRFFREKSRNRIRSSLWKIFKKRPRTPI